MKHITHTCAHTVYLKPSCGLIEIHLFPFSENTHTTSFTPEGSLSTCLWRNRHSVSCEHQPCPASSHRAIWPSRASINHLPSLGFHVPSPDFSASRSSCRKGAVGHHPLSHSQGAHGVWQTPQGLLGSHFLFHNEFSTLEANE